MPPSLPDSLFDPLPPASPSEWALSMAAPADAGHLDELRGEGPHGLSPAWAAFFEHTGNEGLADLNRRADSLQRQLRDNGVSYNVYADPGGQQRPWALDLFPMIVGPQDWARIEAGVLQRARLLNAMMADLYGPQELLRRSLLPAALVQGHPGYLRAVQGMQPPGGQWLRILGFDLARGPDGQWSVIAQRTQAPSGLGYLLENRLAIARQFPRAFAGLRVQRLAASYRALIQGIQDATPEGAQARIALLTPGPYNETYFEHAYLARYLGLTLVEGNDLTVRDQRLFLKTLGGLEPVHALIKRLDDPWLDPLELRTDSTLGVPGLLQVLRAGQVLLANAPGSGPLESSALLGFLPAISEHLLGEPLALPSLPTWWCGEEAALHSALPQLRQGVIKPTYPQRGPDSVIGQGLTPQELAHWAARLQREPEQHTVQSWLPVSQTPTWSGERLMPRSALLRVFAFADGPGSWRVLPGGLVRLAPRGQFAAAMQRGGSSADCWVLTEGPVDHSSLLPSPASAQRLAQPKQPVTSRAAENLFWLGRYTERAENSARLAQIVLELLEGEEPGTPGLLDWLSAVARENALVLEDVPAAALSPRVFARSLVANLAPRAQDGAASPSRSVGFNLLALRGAAAQVRERLSREHWSLIERVQTGFAEGVERLLNEGELNAGEAQSLLQSASELLAAITGSQTDRMVRDDGWRLLSIGRLIERLATLSRALALALESGSVHEPAGFEALVALFDSTITFHAQYQQRRDMVALVDLLVLDRDNPRSLAWVLQTLRARLAPGPERGAAGRRAGPPVARPGAVAAGRTQRLATPRRWPPDLGRAGAADGRLRGRCGDALGRAHAPALQPRRPAQPKLHALRGPAMLLRVLHRTTYHYPVAVDMAQHMLHLCPRDGAQQRVLSHRLDIQPPPATQHRSQDAFGNPRCFFAQQAPHEQLSVLADSLIETRAPRPWPQDGHWGSLSWEAAREHFRYRQHAPYEAAAEFLFPSPLVEHDPRFVSWAEPAFAPGRPLLLAARALMERIHEELRYEPASTEVNTPPLQALEQGKGVCQDFAHIFIACLRGLGLPARYVSGYLLTQPPPGRARLIGADASHAWAALYVPGQGKGEGEWFHVDPTNRRCGWDSPGEDYVTLAIGRDFSDVSPMRGVIQGGAQHRLEVAVTVAPPGEIEGREPASSND